MKLSTYLSQKRGRQVALAKAIGAHVPDVSRWASGKRPIPLEYGAAIEKATGGAVTRKDEWPEEYATYWPELVEEARAA
ncbi:Uncharacterized protein conserved in bacteria%2C prophage-related [Achromobacter sp. 2789STDY5608633]|uniref:transcriptional regulator n=1 Tax=Achromobacter sp. 2789STDY5608633 TaxID=1806501 RepID=UPI0006C086C7|nr:YdaS family helix-turn-helix protein [Achromobacter sp. 2789STDY5608633]CUJ79208.1 Uncharacterized protein conserved in bacteria%2C prophage-related [Achromobacter sp. 2789STDY5608633]